MPPLKRESYFWPTVITLSCLKTLFIPAYFSTDFEVHRNWLAITYSVPFSEWYYEKTSEWTLDYPPLFAWFEWLLAKFAVFFDPEMLVVENLNYSSPMTILFQRLSVIVADILLAFGAHLCCVEVGRKYGKGLEQPVFILIMSNCGLLLVDHIHFQYNGMLFGLLFLALARLLQGRNIEATIWFSVLLCMKHIFAYMAPALIVYMLRSHCLRTHPRTGAVDVVESVKALLSLALPAAGVGLVTFGPIIATGQFNQMLSRLFPFKRGLTHAYWAPNFWALYNAADKSLTILGRKMKMLDVAAGNASNTGGLVTEYNHVVLPNVTPLATALITVIAMTPILVWLWRNPHKPWCGVRATVICASVSYMFGWHVHEKAILMVILPLSLLCVQEQFEAQTFLLTSIVGHFSLLPLIFTAAETPIKILLWLTYIVVCWRLLSLHWYPNDHLRLFNRSLTSIPLTNGVQTLYLMGLLPILLLQSLPLFPSLPFIGLLATSVYCAAGLFYVTFSYYYTLLTMERQKMS